MQGQRSPLWLGEMKAVLATPGPDAKSLGMCPLLAASKEAEDLEMRDDPGSFGWTLNAITHVPIRERQVSVDRGERVVKTGAEMEGMQLQANVTSHHQKLPEARS